MTYKTHITFAASLALPPALYLYSQYSISRNELELFLASLSVGALLPDIDHTRSYISHKIPLIPQLLSLYTKHRGFTHSIYGIIAVFLLLLLAIKFWHFHIALAIGFLIGYILHIIGDSLSVSGIKNFCCGKSLAPLPKFLRYKTGEWSEHIYFFISFSLIVLEFTLFLDPKESQKLLNLLYHSFHYLQKSL